MCGTCGCSANHEHEHEHEHEHGHEHGHDLPTRTIALERDLLEDNAKTARENRDRLARTEICAINLLSSPGSGKTTLLEATCARLVGRRPVCAIEGDQQTDRDAERIRRAGARAHQIETDRACHLDAATVREAIEALDPPAGSMLFIENVGNLVCPAMFDLGEARRVVIASVTEGEDKPLKYPYMFRGADLVVLSKVDLLEHLDFERDAFFTALAEINPAAPVIELSSKTGEGLGRWLDWLESHGPPR